MDHSYASLNTLKSRLSIPASDTDSDTQLLVLLEAASEALDEWCLRWFYVREEARYLHGSGTPLFLPDDLLSIDASGFVLDEDGDGVYESTLATTDYVLEPLNDLPKTWIVISSDSDYGGFASGIKQGVKITGKWGYGDGKSATPYVDSGANVPSENLAQAATSLALTASDGDKFSAGQTIRINNEQLYITAVVTDTLTLMRGMNGTTDAAHTSGDDIYIYRYPRMATEAVIIQASRWHKRKDSAFQDAVGSPELGMLLVYKGLDADVQLLVAALRRHPPQG